MSLPRERARARFTVLALRPGLAGFYHLPPDYMNPSETNPELGRTILEVVENQIRDNDPPETRQTVDRLLADGYTAEEARRLISTAVTVEIFHIMRDREPFNRKRFLWNLANLPQEPWDHDGNEFYKG